MRKEPLTETRIYKRRHQVKKKRLFLSSALKHKTRCSHVIGVTLSGSDPQVILDLLQFSGVEVKRALSSERPLLDALKITSFPSVYLLHPNGTHTHLPV